MSTVRAVAVIVALALATAGVVAFVSRAPASIRADKPGRAATDPSLGARFSEEQVERAAAFRGPSYLAFVLGTLVQIAALVLLLKGPFARLVDASERLPGGWPVRTVAAILGLIIFMTLVGLPLAFVRGYAAQHAWGLSTQDFGGWLSDALRGLMVGGVTSSVATLAFYGLVRWQPRTWWLWGWIAFSLLSTLLVFVWPIAIAPLFNKFTPLRDEALKGQVTQLAHDAGVDVDRVLVTDASRRSTVENAYVAGLGKSKQVVLYDTLLSAGDDKETLFVVAHELGHDVENHVVKNLMITSIGLFGGFAALAWLSTRGGLWTWAHSSGIADLRALPLLLLFTVVVGVLLLPTESAISRSFESQADSIAIDLTNDAATAVRAFRRLAFDNIADLRPPRIAVWALFSHPPTADRIRAVVEEASSAP
jgi:STE24 endopeptidase